MYLNLSNKTIFLTSLTTGLLLIFLTEPMFDFLHKGTFNKYESIILEPVFYWSLFLFLSSAILFLFSQEIFNAWLRKIFIWFVPLGLLITLAADSSMSYTLPDKTGFAIFFGEILVAATLIFALVQKFVYKK